MSIYNPSFQSIGIVGAHRKMAETNAERLSRYEVLSRAYNELMSSSSGLSEHPDRYRKVRNYLRKFVSVHSEFGFSAGFRISIPDDPETEDVETDTMSKVGEYTTKVWEANGGKKLLLQAGQYGSLLGDVFLRVSWDSEVDPLYTTKPMVRLHALHPGAVLPIFNPRTGGLDAAMIAIAPEAKPEDLNSRTVMATGYASPRGERELDQDLEFWTKDEVVYYRNGQEIRVRNDLGFVPVIHIPNYPSADSQYGESDVAAMLDSQSEYTSATATATRIMRYHAEPTTVLIGANASNLEKGEGKMWSIANPEAKIVNLEVKDSIEAILQFMDKVKTDMHELSNLPDGILGSIDTGDSAAATLLKFQPLLTRWKVKQEHYSRGIVLVNRAILRIAQMRDEEMQEWFLKLDADRRYNTKVSWENPMPREESLDLDKAAKRLQLGLSTRQHELIDRFGFSPADAAEMVSASRKEREEDAYVEMQAATGFGLDPRLRKIEDEEGAAPATGRSGNPSPSRPNPEVQSNARSMTVLQNAARGGSR